MSRILDVFVLNQGHGEIGRFEDWSANDLSIYMVQPMVDAGIKVNILILDFCESASLIGYFGRLLTPEGVIVSTLYSTGAVLTTDVWRQIDVPLQQRDVATIQQVLRTRMTDLTRRNTGFAHLDEVRGWSEPQVAQHLRTMPQDRDAISIVRYLPEIADAVRVANLAQGYAALAQLRSNGNVGFGEQALLAFLPLVANQYDAGAAALIQSKLADRVGDILSLQQYGLDIDVINMQLFAGEPNRWQLLMENRDFLLAQAMGLLRCPSPYALFTADGQTLVADREFTLQPMDPAAAILLGGVDATAAQHGSTIVRGLRESGVAQAINAQPNFLQ